MGNAYRLRGVVLSLLGMTLSACQLGPSSGDGTPTPIPTPPNTVRAVCDSARPALDRLDGELGHIDSTTLSNAGSAIAQITGILTTDLERLRAVPESATSDLTAWFGAIEKAAGSGVRAVRAAADRDLDAFRSAAEVFESDWAAARAAGVRSGYDSCPY